MKVISALLKLLLLLLLSIVAITHISLIICAWFFVEFNYIDIFLIGCESSVAFLFIKGLVNLIKYGDTWPKKQNNEINTNEDQ